MEFYVAKLPGDQLDIYAPCDILFPQDLSSGKPVNTRDFEIARNASQDLLDLNRYTQVIGGDPVLVQLNGQDVYRYKMNITAHFKQLQKTKNLWIYCLVLYLRQSQLIESFYMEINILNIGRN